MIDGSYDIVVSEWSFVVVLILVCALLAVLVVIAVLYVMEKKIETRARASLKADLERLQKEVSDASRR